MTNANRPKLVRNTPEEEAEINRQIAEDPDAPEWTDEDWANAKSTEELFPEAAEAARKRKADLDAGRTEFITLLLDRDTINWFKAQTGEDGATGGNKVVHLGRAGPEGTCQTGNRGLTGHQSTGVITPHPMHT